MLVSEIPVVNTFLPQGDQLPCSGRAQRREVPQISPINKRFSQIICAICGQILGGLCGKETKNPPQRREVPQISPINKRFSQIICVVCGYILLNSLRFEQGEERSSRGAYF
jgi:hypothetical protein